MPEGEGEGKKTKVDKPVKSGYKVKGKSVKSAKVKSNKTDTGGNFYIFDLFDDDNKCVTLNGYVYKNSPEQMFDELTEDEELILNPIEEPVEVI